MKFYYLSIIPDDPKVRFGTLENTLDNANIVRSIGQWTLFFMNIWICTSVHVEKQSVNDIETPRIYRRMYKHE